MTPELVVVGHVTRDLIGGEERLGGAASFAAMTAAALGIRTGLVTTAPEGFRLLAPLAEHPCIALARQDSATVTTFELDYSGPTRAVFLRERAPSIVAASVPEAFRDATVVYLGPVIGECGGELAGVFTKARVAVGLQGWLRGVEPTGRVVPALLAEARDPPANLHVACFSELDHPDAEELARELARRVDFVALTRGARGATVYERGQPRDYPAAPAREVDPTGAGDVFGLVLTLSLARGASVAAAVQRASFAAARVIEGPGMGRLSAAALDDWDRAAQRGRPRPLA